MYTEFKLSHHNGGNILVCVYCKEQIVDLVEDPFYIFYNPNIQKMINDSTLVCTCELAQKELSIKKIIEIKKKEIERLEIDITNLLPDMPF